MIRQLHFSVKNLPKILRSLGLKYQHKIWIEICGGSLVNRDYLRHFLFQPIQTENFKVWHFLLYSLLITPTRELLDSCKWGRLCRVSKVFCIFFIFWQSIMFGVIRPHNIGTVFKFCSLLVLTKLIGIFVVTRNQALRAWILEFEMSVHGICKFDPFWTDLIQKNPKIKWQFLFFLPMTHIALDCLNQSN